MSPGNVDNALRSIMALVRNTFVAGWEGLLAGTTSGIPVSNGAGTITAKAAPTGDIVGTSDAQTLTNKTISGLVADLAVADGGTGASTAAAAFANIATTASSLAIPGYHKFPSGLLIQWGRGTLGANSTGTITYPAAYSIASICSAGGGDSDVGTADQVRRYGAATTTGASIVNPHNATNTYEWIAIGV